MSIPHAVLGIVSVVVALWGFIEGNLNNLGTGAFIAGVMVGIIIAYDEKEIKTQSEILAELRKKAEG